MRWFRMYHEAVSDPKLRRIARCAGATMATTLAVWTSMLAHASSNKGEERGTLAGWDDTDCAINLDIDPPVVFSIRREMEGRLLDGLKIMAWADRQFTSDDSAPRQRKRRQNTNETPTEENQGVKSDVTACHGDVTAPDTDTDSEEEKESSLRSDSRAPAQALSQARAARKSKNGFDYSDEFLLFWEGYPRKQDQPAAWRAWKARRCDKLPFEAISEALDAYCGDVEGKDRQFIKLPATWLNNTPWRVVSLLDQPSAIIAESRHAKQH